MLVRLCSLLVSLLLLCACGKNMPQVPNIVHNQSALNGLWIPSSTGQTPALALSNDGRIAFIYPQYEGYKQAQKVHHQIPLLWSAHEREFSVTTINVNAPSSPDSNLPMTEVFTYALALSDKQAMQLVLQPTQNSKNNESLLGHNYVQNDADMGTISGSLFYRERMMLPPDAIAFISLQQINRADASAIILSSMAIDGANLTPLSFQIPYIKSDIVEGYRYSLRAYIMSQGELLFSTTNAYPVLRRGQAVSPASVDMLLHRVHSQEEKAQDTQGVSLQQTYWALQSLRGQAVQHFEGQEAPHIVLANDGKSSGSDGCNRFFGSYTSHEHRIAFFPGGNTMMMCPQGDKQAALFMSSLQEATAYNITEQTLELLRGKDVIARFTAKPMP